MASQLLLIGTNHETAPIGVRERLAVTRAELPQALEQVAALEGVREACILSTCNRTELYMVGDSAWALASARSFLAQLGQMKEKELAPYLYEMWERECVAHLFSVAAGANSMILGDAQILGQIKESFAIALQMGVLGKTLNALLRRALRVGKVARTRTKIGGKAASLSYAATEVAKRERGDLASARVLIAGAGRMGRLMAKILADNGVRGMLFANRTFGNAIALAEEFRGKAVEFSDVTRHLGEVDIAITVTEAPCFIMHREDIAQALSRHRGKGLLLIDLGTPRNIDGSVRELEGVTLYDIDDLSGVIKKNLQERQEELKKVQEILAEEVDEFMGWHSSNHLGSTIKALLERAEAIRKEELQKVDGKLARLSPRERNAIDMATSRILNRLLHPPIARLKAAAAAGSGEELARAARALFQLDAIPHGDCIHTPKG